VAPDPQGPASAAALVIGNELLSGKIADCNIVVLARTLQDIGIKLERVVMVVDDVDVIAHEVHELSASHGVVFTSGGVGPTHDDLTVDGVAKAFGVAVEGSPEIEALLRDYYGAKLTDGHLRMARVPLGARLVVTEKMPWPTTVMRNVWILPGVPQIFEMKMAVVAKELRGRHQFFSCSVFNKLDEGNLKPLLDAVVAAHAEVEIGSYPQWRLYDYRTKVTFDGHDQQTIERAREAFVATLPAGTLVTGEGGGEP